MQYIRKIQIGFQEGTCPLRCKKCLAFGENARKKKQVRKMALDKAKILVDEISKMEIIPSIQPSIHTEPFANEDLKENIPYCYNKNVPLNIITNGILLNEEWMDLLIKWMNRSSVISFSLDAVTQETYGKVRGDYSLEDLENKVMYLMENRGDSGPRVSVNYTYEEDNYEEKDIFLERWKNKVDAVRINVALDSHRKIPDIYRKEEKIKNHGVCSFLRETMTIDSDGEIRLCSVDAFGETNLGNVFEEGIVPIWTGEKMEMFREKNRLQQFSQEDFCYGCEWGDSVYDFNEVEETDSYILKVADYAIYYNRK